MSGRSAIFSLMVLLLLAHAPTARGTVGQSKVRDLSRYQSIGPFKIGHFDDTRDDKQTRIRSFIWRHWRAHQLAKASVTYFNMEGEQRDYTYLVEPDESGRWRIAITLDGTSYPRGMRPGRGPRSYRETVSYEAYYVDRIEIPKRSYADPDPDRVAIPVGARRAPRSYRLLLSNEAGKTVGEL